MMRFGRSVSKGARLMALVMTPLFVFAGTASAQVSAGSVAASFSSVELAEVRLRARRILGGAIGATGGFFAGGYLGAVIEGDRCNCDDPGLMGALIGAPVGAVTGGILGALFF